MRTAPILAAIVLSAITMAPAHAAFDIAHSYDLAPSPSIHAPAAPGGIRPTVAPPRRVAVPIARGFGACVPLAFAIRQIVPVGKRVTLADGVDPDTPVDWQGGRPWDRTLAAAAAPLGLRLVANRGGWILQP